MDGRTDGRTDAHARTQAGDKMGIMNEWMCWATADANGQSYRFRKQGSLVKLEFEEIEKFVGDTWRSLFKLKKTFNGRSNY